MIDAPSCSGLFIQIFMGPFTPLAMGGHKYFIMFIDDYFCYGFVELIHERSDSLETFKISKQKLSSNKGRRSKWFIMIEVVSIMVDMMRQDATLDHLRSTFKNVALMLSIQCLVLLNRMRLQRGGITHFLIWCNVCLLIPHYLSSYGVKL